MPAAAPAPITTRKVLILLFLILVLTIADLSLSLVHLGLTSFFLGLIASSAAIIHILTQFITIVFRLRCQSNPLHGRMTPWEDLPPTSKMSCMTMNILLAILFIAAFVITLLAQILHYFGGGSVSGGATVFKEPRGVIYADAAMELLCAIMLIILALVGWSERRLFLEVKRNAPLNGVAM